MFERIELNPEILGGKPIIKGTRLPIYVILEALAAGDTKEEILNTYPFINQEDISQAIGYAARLLQIGVEEP